MRRCVGITRAHSRPGESARRCARGLPEVAGGVLEEGCVRTAAKRDTPERDIIAAAEALGAVVLQVSGVGLPDTLVCHRGRTYLVEVKRPKKGLTHAQGLTFKRIHESGVPVYVVETPEQMRRLLEEDIPEWRPDSRPVEGEKKRPHRPGHSRARTLEECCKLPTCRTSAVLGDYFCAKHEEKT